MHQVTLIRAYTLRKLKEIRAYITMLPETEHDALRALTGPEGNKNAADIADFILERLGHQSPLAHRTANGETESQRLARKFMPTHVPVEEQVSLQDTVAKVRKVSK